MSRILVTGATGFLGSAVVKQLEEAGCAVRTTGRQESLHPFDDYWPADLRDTALLPEMLAGVSCVIHCAGLAHQFHAGPEHDSLFHSINCEATARLARTAAAGGVQRFLYVSSVSVYGQASDSCLRNEDSLPAPVGAYAKSKRQAEIELLRIAEETGLEVTILRMATLYGEGDPGNLGRLMDALGRGRFVMIGPGQNRKSLIHRDDAAAACVKAALHSENRPGGIWNIAGEACSMKVIVHQIAESLHRQPPRWSVPAAMAGGLLGTAAVLGIGRLRHWAQSRRRTLQKWLAEDAYDGSRFAQEFHWQPQVSLEEGLHRMADFKGKVLETGSEPFSRSVSAVAKTSFSMKRLFDVLGACYLLVLLAVPMALIALAVKLTSRGPVLYWSDRVGRRNRIFRMPKFRSMRTDAPELPTHLLTDSRHWITALGGFLRKTSLDELPQLWSILRGDMSFVGPRPALFNQEDLISLRTEKGIHELTPGLTGWAQINGRDELPIPEKVALDEIYLHRRSLAWDVKILLLTALKVLQSEGVAQTGDGGERETRRAA